MRCLATRIIAVLTLASTGAVAATGQDYACERLLPDSTRLLLALLDPWTGLPYDQVPCLPAPTGGAPDFNRAWGVVPQLAYAEVNTFAEDPAHRDSTVLWSFTDRGPQGAAPTLLSALRVELHLSPPGGGNAFGGLTWGVKADLSRPETCSTPRPIMPRETD